ncbi:MAG: hypothetical protein Q4D20_01960 [Clostridia bacterium]|nr:hypothetical protein [Clostridia bacterium]
MNTGKKLLSVLLSLLMIVSTVSISFTTFTVSAVDGNDLKSAFEKVTDASLTNGDGTMLNAAEVLYNYVYGIASTGCNGVNGNGSWTNVYPVDNNSSVDLNNSAKSAAPGYDAFINALIPTDGVTDDSNPSRVTGSKTLDTMTCQTSPGFKSEWVGYGINNDANHSVTVSADLEKVLLTYGSLGDVPESILLSATYSYTNTVRRYYTNHNSDTKKWGMLTKRVWYWSAVSWQTLSQKPTRTGVTTNEKAYTDLHAFADYFTSSKLSTTLNDLVKLSASEINAIIASNNEAYSKLDLYSDNVKNHFFDMTAVKAYMDNCVFAQKVINAKPAIESLGNAMIAGYDTSDLASMTEIYTAQKPNLDFVKSVSADVIEYVRNNFKGFSDFSVENAEKFMTQLDKDIQLYKIREIKAAVDSLRAQYPDAEAIKGIEDNQLLWNYYDLIKGYNNTLETAFTQSYVAEVFADGTGYVKAFEEELKFEWDYREAEEQYESFWPWFLPLVYADLTKVPTSDIIGSNIAENIPNIKNAVSKKSAFDSMYEKYVSLIGKDAMETIFGAGENALGNIIDDYIARLYNTILARLESEVGTAVGYYDAYGEVNLSNFTAIKDAIGRVETNIWDYLNSDNPSLISDQLRTDYNRLSSLLNMYNSFVASKGLNNFEQKHLHDNNGIFMTRDVTDEDLARKNGEEYNVTEDVVNETIEKLDKFLTSKDFTNIVNIDADNLSDYIKQVLADNLYTNKFVNMLMGVLYPELVKALENLYNSLPREVWYDAKLWKDKIKVGYKSLPDLITGLGMGLYPNQVANYIDGFDTVRNQLYSAGGDWNALKNGGDLILDWGIDSIKPENYSSTAEFINAKKSRFMNAMSESFDAILPLIRVLFADWDGFNTTVNKAGYGEYLGVKLNADLNLTADGCAGYADLVTPILEALGCDGIPSYNEVRGYTTSRQIVNAIFNPLIDFVENKLAKNPVATLCSVLPNLAYAVSMDKLWERFQYLNVRLNYRANDSALNIKVIDDHYDLRLNDFVNKNSLGLDFDVSSFSSIVSYLVGMFVDGIDSSSMPIMNAGSLITHASLDTNAPTKRLNGARINFTADKADVFMAVLGYLTKCLGNNDFVDLVYKQFSKDPEMSDELKTIIKNIYTSVSDENGNMAVAAIIELLNQTEYALEDYKWLKADSASGTVDGTTPASKVYLTYKNNWTKQAADYVANNLDAIVKSVLKTSGSEVDFSAMILDGINGIFTNSAVTSVAKGLSSMISLPKNLTELINSELGVDLTAFEKYKDIDEEYNWGFADGDREAFTKALVSVLEPLSPLFGFLFKGENIHIFKNNADLVLYGNDGYDSAIVPLLEAFGCEVKKSDEFASKDTVATILDALYARIDKLASDPINEVVNILPGVIYYLSSGALSVAVRNLLHPLYVIIDTIRPVYEVDVKALAAQLGESVNLKKLDASFVQNIIEEKTGLKLDGLSVLLEDVSKVIGKEYSSQSEFLKGNAFKGAYIDGVFDKGDMLTVVLSYLIEALSIDGNAAVVDKLLGAENFTGALLSVFNGTDPEKKKINWMYYFDEDTDFTKLDFEKGVIVSPTVESLTYPNNWTANSAEYINSNLDDVIATVLKAAGETGTLGEVLKSKVNLYTGENLEKINSAIVDLLKNVDKTLAETVNVVLGLDLSAAENYKAPEGTLSGDEFANELSKILAPFEKLLDWLLFSEDYSFLTGTKKDSEGNYIYNDLITIKGGAGYKNGLVPVLEALGCKNIPAESDSDVLNKALKSLFARVDEILADPANELLAVLPNVIYFLNADGLTASVYNLLSAVYALTASLEKIGAKIDVNELLGVDLSDISFEKIISLAEEKTGMDLLPVKKMFCGLCIGTIKQYLSGSGEYAYKMEYAKASDRKDMITLILTVLVETVKLSGNEEKLRELVGNDVYDAVLGVMNLRRFDMQKPNYKNTEYADTDKTFSAIETSVLFSGYKYGPLYTQQMAQYIADNFDDFLDNLVYLLGIEVNGNYVDSFKDVLNALVNGNLYNSKNIQTILDKLLEFSGKIDAVDGGNHVKELIKASLGVDLDAWKSYKVPEFENDRAKFTEALCDIIRPLYPVLKWMLCKQDFTFFVDEEKNNLVTLLGAEGYAYGIIPLLETLGCDSVLTPEKYYSAVNANEDAIVTSITEPLFDRIDKIMSNPADEILEMLPQVIYFVNSNGLDTCFKNALHSVYGILNAIEPLVKVDLYSLIKVRLDEVTFESLYKYALEKIEEKTGQKLSSLGGDAFLELTVGKLVSYTSANGEKAYKMIYQSNTAKAEMVTVIERLAIRFVMNEDNRTKVLNILKSECNMSPDAEKYVKAVLDLLATYATTHFGMDQSLFAIYEIFYGAKTGTDYSASGLKNLNAKWKEILKMLNGSDDPNAQGLGTLIGKILDKYLDGIFDSNGLASNGFIVFWQKIVELFKKIAEFFNKLFK